MSQRLTEGFGEAATPVGLVRISTVMPFQSMRWMKMPEIMM
jgi:hypothetical protein